MPRRRRLRLLITAGPTREYVDPVRYISNYSSGKMGFALAAAAVARGLRATLVHGPVDLRPPSGVRSVAVVSADQMLAACTELWPRHDILLMAAAVADYVPVRPARSKRKKSSAGLLLRLKPTVDILATLAADRREDQVVIGFALEDRAARRNAERKLNRKGLDAIVLNRPEAIGAERSAVEVLVRGEDWRVWPAGSKARHGARIVELAGRLWVAKVVK